MNGPHDRRSEAESPGAASVRAMLDAVAATHEPDRDRIRARMERVASSPAPSGGRATRSRPAWRYLAPLATAAAAVLVAVLVVDLSGTGPGPTDTNAAPGPLDGRPGPSVTLTPSPTSAPTAAPPTPDAKPAGPTGLAPSGPPAEPPPAVGPPAVAGPVIGVGVVAAGHQVVLPAETAGWLATVRSDGTVVRAKNPRWQLDLRVRGTTTPGRAGAFRVSWAGGRPEQSHDDATGWLAVAAGGQAEVVVPALDAPADLVLYLGGQGADAVVTAGAARASVPGRTPQAALVTITVPASTGSTVVTVTAADPVAGGYVGLAAVELR